MSQNQNQSQGQKRAKSPCTEEPPLQRKAPSESAVEANAAPLVLTYWNVRGLAAQIRLALTIAGADFENKTLVTMAAFAGAEQATKSHPLFNVPMLTVEGQHITQSGAIMRHVGKTFNIAGKTTIEGLRVEEVLETLVDFRKELLKYTYAGSADAAAELKPSFLSETVPYYLGGLDKYMARNNTTFVASNEVTTADCAVFTELVNVAEMLEKTPADTLAEFPALWSLFETMAAMPAVQKYLEHEDMGKLRANGPGATWSAIPMPE